jgi:hypothetical protein
MKDTDNLKTLLDSSAEFIEVQFFATLQNHSK